MSIENPNPVTSPDPTALDPAGEQPMLPFVMEPIPAERQATRSWQVSVNGKLMPDVSHVKLEHPGMGVTAEYGLRPEDYDGLVIRERGGAATIPYMIDEAGHFYAGMVREPRPTMGEPITENIPRGFSDFGETKDQTAQRELAEETGYHTLAKGMIKLAEGLNPNSTWLDFSHDKSEGVDIYAVQVQQSQLELSHDETGRIYYEFPATIRNQAEGDKAAERIVGSVFIPLADALKSRDMFTSAAAGQLVSYLLSQGEYLVPQNKPAK